MENYNEVKHLIEYKQLLTDKILSLRKEACQVAKKSRELDKLLTPELLEEYKLWDAQLAVYDF